MKVPLHSSAAALTGPRCAPVTDGPVRSLVARCQASASTVGRRAAGTPGA